MQFSDFFVDINTKVKDHDFINSKFDNDSHNCQLKRLYFLISTPRSGSTWLCSEIYKKYGIVVHEYLQTSQYIPLFADSSGLLNYDQDGNYKLDFEKYVDALCIRRSKDGVLGINVHISHLYLALKLKESIIRRYPQVNVISHFLTRKDKVLQAISYAKAASSGVWSKVDSGSKLIYSDNQKFNNFFESMLEIFIAPLASVKYKYLLKQEKNYLNNYSKLPYSFRFEYESLSKDINYLNSGLKKIGEDLNIEPQITLNKEFKLLKTGHKSYNFLSFFIKNYGILLRALFKLECLVKKIKYLILRKKKKNIISLKIYF